MIKAEGNHPERIIKKMKLNDKKRFSYKNTVLLLDDDDRIGNLLRKLCEQNRLEVWEIQQPSDLIAVPSFLAIINPTLLDNDAWDNLIVYLNEVNDPSFKILFTDYCAREPRIPYVNIIKQPEVITEEFLKFLILKTRSTVNRKKAIETKALRRIVRLMHIIRILQNGGTLRLKDISSELEVSSRTVLRDIEILEMAGLILDRTESGGYRFPNSFNVFDVLYEGISKKESDTFITDQCFGLSADEKHVMFGAVCIDFDGVIVKESPSIDTFGELIPGAKEALESLRESGYKIIIHTSRSDSFEALMKIMDFLDDNGIPYDEINVNSDCCWSAPKPPADLYIDDRALRFNGDWPETLAAAEQILGVYDVESVWKDNLKMLFKGYVGLFDYCAAVNEGRLAAYRYLIEDDIEFSQSHPDHPLSAENRLVRIAAADFFKGQAKMQNADFDIRTLRRLYKALFDCCAAVRLSIAEALFHQPHPLSVSPLQELFEDEKESQAVKSMAWQALTKIKSKNCVSST